MQTENDSLYHVMEKYTITKPETEMPIWNQIVGMANIQVDILKKLISSKGGLILQTNTDYVSCMFPDNRKNNLPYSKMVLI